MIGAEDGFSEAPGKPRLFEKASDLGFGRGGEGTLARSREQVCAAAQLAREFP
jgi:hypothetical protein